jgi:hypothetical protein
MDCRCGGCCGFGVCVLVSSVDRPPVERERGVESNAVTRKERERRRGAERGRQRIEIDKRTVHRTDREFV